MNVTLEWFLEHLYSNDMRNDPPVQIYEWIDGFYHTDRWKRETTLVAIYKSDYKPSYMLSDKIYRRIVKEFYWTADGIVILIGDEHEGE